VIEVELERVQAWDRALFLPNALGCFVIPLEGSGGVIR
jgi:hypothetical protein